MRLGGKKSTRDADWPFPSAHTSGGSILSENLPDAGDGEPPLVRTASQIRDWIVTHIATRLGADPSTIAVDQPVIDVGLDSMEFVAMVGELEQWLGCRFRDNPLIDYPTIESLSGFLAAELAAGRRIISPAAPR
jgi:phthiocerol/phenolphthiocerol synthesis type-I polyketide synthase D